MSDTEYCAFISYSHADEKWASWLHRALETYKVPGYLVGEQSREGKIPARLGKVFRDREELASSSSLGADLTRALAASACQIVICSPNAAKSHWTNEEILTFKRMGREDHIFCLIVDGEPNSSDQECFPPALKFQMGKDGELSDTPAEPIAADARPQGDGKQNAKLKLISGMLGVGFDALKQRDAQRRHRRMMAITAAASVGMIITSGLAAYAVIQRDLAEEQRIRAETEAETARQTTDFLVGLFNVSDPNEAQGNTITAREILDKGTARIATELSSQPAIQAALMETMGTVYKSLALYRSAAPLLEDALRIRREIYGDTHVEIADSLDRLGEVYKLTAEYEQSEAMYRDALEQRRALLGPEHEDVARSLYELADLLTRIGRFEEAEPLFRDALAMHRKLSGDESAAVAQSLEGLALNHYDRGDNYNAVRLMRESVTLQRRLHDDPHTDLAEAINNLGFLLGESGEYEESERLFREALQIKRYLLGDKHTEIALGLNNIAFALHDQGKYDEAEKMYRDAIAIQRELLGDDHPQVAAGLNNLAFLLYEKGNLAVAREMMQQSLEKYRRTVGDEHPAVARGMANIAMWQMESGNYDAAEQLIRDSVELRRRILGEYHRDVAASLTLYAVWLIENERYEEARDTASEARRIFLLALDESHWRTAAAASAEGAAMIRLGDPAKGELLLQQSYEVLTNDSGSLPFLANSATRWLADYYQTRGDADKAAMYRARMEKSSGI